MRYLAVSYTHLDVYKRQQQPPPPSPPPPGSAVTYANVIVVNVSNKVMTCVRKRFSEADIDGPSISYTSKFNYSNLIMSL